MTDTKEFNKSLDRIAKALGGEEWSPEDKPEAIYKLLDKIADVLEERDSGSSGGGSSEPFIVGSTTEGTVVTLNKTWNEIKTALESGKVVLLDVMSYQYFDDGCIYYALTSIEYFGGNATYEIYFGEHNSVNFTANSADDYPSVSFD